MAQLSQTEILRELKQLADFINEIELSACILEENPAIDEPSLLIGLPGEIENGRYVICNFLPLSEENARFTKYLHLFNEIGVEVSEIDLTALLLAINNMNHICPVGHFTYNPDTGHGPRVQMRGILAASTDDVILGSVLCETYYMMNEYSIIMEEILAGLAGGMALEEIFRIEGIVLRR